MSKGLTERVWTFINPWSQERYDPYGPQRPLDSDVSHEPDAGAEPDDTFYPPGNRAERSEFAGVTIIRAEPQDMDEATAVADEIKHRLPVLLNLQNVPEPDAMRIRDFLGGVTYGLNGYMRRIAEWVYICSPFDMPVETLVLTGTSVSDREQDSPFTTPAEY